MRAEPKNEPSSNFQFVDRVNESQGGVWSNHQPNVSGLLACTVYLYQSCVDWKTGTTETIFTVCQSFDNIAQ